MVVRIVEEICEIARRQGDGLGVLVVSPAE